VCLIMLWVDTMWWHHERNVNIDLYEGREIRSAERMSERVNEVDLNTLEPFNHAFLRALGKVFVGWGKIDQGDRLLLETRVYQ
jgi:hypothetical protein